MTGKTLTTLGGKDRVNMRLSTGTDETPNYVYEDTLSHPTAEQLFAGAWSACFTGAMRKAAQGMKVALPSDTAVEIAVDLGITGNAYLLQARIDVSLPGLPQDVAEALVHEADQICPYSKATRSNIDVVLNVTTA
ncbi:Ohr family peroxiredoxin [Micavibrio aeruginosavorus]|uniref:Ohr family peroxiredoxin n=1 Tax=Micavibrio aeruginosavorus TaxID=349221 RepID=UPI003F4AD036